VIWVVGKVATSMIRQVFNQVTISKLDVRKIWYYLPRPFFKLRGLATLFFTNENLVLVLSLGSTERLLIHYTVEWN
jgi:hypothetical protein